MLQRAAHAAAPSRPAAATILARVKLWCPVKEVGYVTPVDTSQTNQGVDVQLTAESVRELKRPLVRDELVEVTIDPPHVRPRVLLGGLKRANRAG